MPQELPGFYYDPEKNRYFPIKGPIPGSGSSRKPADPPPLPIQERNAPQRHSTTSKLLHNRELYGNVMNLYNQRISFEQEYMKKLVSQPKVWKYADVESDGDGAVSLVHINVETHVGQCRADALLTGSVNGSLSLYDVGDIGHQFNHGAKTTSDCVWPEHNQPTGSEIFRDIWKFHGATLILPSSISCISMPRRDYHDADNVGPAEQRALTLGSESAGGSVHLLNLSDPIDLNSPVPAVGRLREVALLDCTVWAADSDYKATKAVVGTNLGAKLVDLETGALSTICRSKSDVLSVQLIQSGDVALCGLRNGAVVTIDARQRQRQLARHRIMYPAPEPGRPTSRSSQKLAKPCFLLKGDLQPSHTVFMPSSISCLASLRIYDQYFLASAMDGSIKLYDHRLTKRGPVQSYEGNVNSHTRIQLATDPCERFVMSGGEDCGLRIWSIKSGEMLFEEKFSSSIPLTVSWRRTRGSSVVINEAKDLEEHHYTQTDGWDAWLGSAEGLFRMQFS